MTAWLPFVITALALGAILALFLPPRHLLLLGIAAAAGIVGAVLLDWRASAHAGPATHRVITMVAALCVVSAILGYLWPWKAWQWGLTPLVADAIWQVTGPTSTVAWGNLGPIPYLFPFYAAALMAIPPIILAEIAAYFARRRVSAS